MFGVAAERHRSGDELKWLVYQVELLGAEVDTLVIRTGALEREAAELRVRPKALLSDGQHL